MDTTSLTWIKGLQFIAHANSKHAIVIDTSEKAVHDAIELSKNKYCSVSAMLAKTAEITYDVEIQNDE